MTSAAYIVAYARTPFTAARKGAFAGMLPDALGAHAIRALLARAAVPAEEIEDVIWGCAFPEAEQGLSLGRVTGLWTGLPKSVAG